MYRKGILSDSISIPDELGHLVFTKFCQFNDASFVSKNVYINDSTIYIKHKVTHSIDFKNKIIHLVRKIPAGATPVKIVIGD